MYHPSQPAVAPECRAPEAIPCQTEERKPSVAVILPAYNEEAIVATSLQIMHAYLQTHLTAYRWEIILVNDGSRDRTPEIADAFAEMHEHVRVVHHPTNFGMGQALITGFRHNRAEYVVTLDLDLSYGPEHIPLLLERIRQTRAKIVVASPYRKEGTLANIPWHRHLLSVWANRLLARVAKESVSSLTGIMRVYDGRFLRSLDLKTVGGGINPEIIYKAQLLDARIDEIPGRLDWGFEHFGGLQRKSSMRILQQIGSVTLSGFMFRPLLFFVLPGLLLLGFAAYVNTWMFIHFWDQYRLLTQYTWFLDRASQAVAEAYRLFPHTFVVGGLALMFAIQLLSLGLLALQNLRNFGDLFHLGTTIYRRLLRDEEEAERPGA
ncbi:MAG: glycosyltransferase family 2 protein [Candidatus Tectimicrobiota bacterium]